MDTSQYLDLFLEESMENVQILNQSLLSLESDPGNLEAVDEIFRAAHTIKGMSATMGFENIAQLTHKMESLLDKIREKELVLNEEIIDVLFQSVDALESMMESVRSGEEPDLDVSKIAADLLTLEKGGSLGSDTNKSKKEETAADSVRAADLGSQNEVLELNEYEKDLLKVVEEKGQKAFQIKVIVEDECVMKGVRAYMVFRNLEPVGEVLKAVPSVQDLEDENFENEFTFIYISALSSDQIRKNIETISEIRVGYIEEINIETYELAKRAAEEEEAKLEEDGKPSPAAMTKNISSNGNKKPQKIHQTVRVDIKRLDNMMSLVGELVINKTRLEQIYTSNNLSDLNETIEQIDRISTDLQNVVQNVRMVAVDQVFNRFPRMVRDLSKELNKDVELVMEGKETELDRTVIDEIGDPLLHLIRNALDHGLESPEERKKVGKPATGTLKLSARHEGNRVMIYVEDDGKGLNPDAIRRKALQNGLITTYQAENMEVNAINNLIFEPGFSTAKEVTDVSGRGVGLDVVRSKIQSLNGQVSLETTPGQGTRFIIKLPLTLAIIQALLVKVQEEIYAIPLGTIDETTSLDVNEIKDIQGQQVMVLRDKVLPLVFLKEILDVPGDKEKSEMYVVVVRRGDQQIGLVADELVGQQDIVINSLGKILSGIRGLAGASILGDGRISLILDIGTLF
ncbi:MAG: chemotaxis protein CheA [Peptococcia bacterium]